MHALFQIFTHVCIILYIHVHSEVYHFSAFTVGIVEHIENILLLGILCNNEHYLLFKKSEEEQQEENSANKGMCISYQTLYVGMALTCPGPNVTKLLTTPSF